MPGAYVTLQQFRDWSEDQSLEVPQRDLDAASRMVRLATVGAMYVVDGNRMPTDAAVAAAMRDATCVVLSNRQVQTDAAELAGITDASINGVSFKLDPSAVRGETGLPLDAHLILLEAGLIGGPVIIYG